MKQFYLMVISLIVSTSLFSQQQQDANLIHTGSKKKSFTNSPHDIDAAWLQQVQASIAESEYYFKKSPISNEYNAANKAQHIAFSIVSNAYSISSIGKKTKNLDWGNWKQTFEFYALSRASISVGTGNKFSLSASEGNLEVKFPSICIQYINNREGLRQNFIVSKKLEGLENLELTLNIQGDLTPSIINKGLAFNNHGGETVLYYQDLKVWDAKQQPINAWMELRGNNKLVIVVNDQKAVYPLTIDPINKTPEWTGSADGILPSLVGQLAVDAAYGFSVAGVGDVNGDGYDDVAVGAPAMVDIIAGTGTLAAVGAVFVYYGSINGLPTTASVVLQPNTAVAGALFGYSITGGDINHDGINDIIVGAPMDAVSVSAGVNSTATGTIGKVYVYDGASLSTVPSPLFSLKLSGNGILENGVNLSVNALFGFSVAVTEDLNGDHINDIIVGSPTYAGIKTGLLGNSLLDVQSGAAFVFLSNNTGHSMVKLEPIKSNLLGIGILANNINGLLFGYCVDGLGDYNGDGKPDVVASAPAGVDVSSLALILNGKLLQGSASVYYGNGNGLNTNPGAVLTANNGGLLSNLTGSISNIANLFGVSIKGVRDASASRNGNVLVGAPLGGALMNVLSLQLKTGTVSLFKRKSSSPSGYVVPDQVLNSPRNSNNILQVIQSNLLFGFSLDNLQDVNCDGIGDIIVGEPVSSGAQLLNANVAGGAAYVYFGKIDGTYQSAPAWTMTATEDAFLGVNGTSLIGYCVAGAGHVKGSSFRNRILAGSPSRTLDFGAGLLNLGATLGTVFSLAGGNNGVGKAFLSDAQFTCGPVLAVSLTSLKGTYADAVAHLNWNTSSELNNNHFEIERSFDGNYFNQIGKVNAKTASSGSSDYHFNDINARQGIDYYRLKIVDNDGSFVYSNIIALKVAIKGTVVNAIYPSPFINKLNISVVTEATEDISIRLFDNSGRLVASQQSIAKTGSNNIIVDNLSSLAKGSYLIQVRTIEKTVTQKLVKQ